MELNAFSELALAENKSDLEKQLIASAQGMDFDVVTGVLVFGPSPAEFKVLGNMPPAFEAVSRNVEYSKRDPVLRRLKARGSPITYDRRFYSENDAADLWEMQAPYGFQTGVAIALHVSSDRRFILGLDRCAPLPSDRELTRLLAHVTLLAVYAQDAATRIFDNENSAESNAANAPTWPSAKRMFTLPL